MKINERTLESGISATNFYERFTDTKVQMDTNMKNLKTAFVGIGGYGGTILKEIFETSTDGFEICAVVDLYVEKSVCYDKISALSIPVYPTMEDMFLALEEKGCKIDLVVISTPIQFHFQQIKCAIEHGANVICEKPMTGDINDIAALEALQSSTDKFIAIGYQWSFSKAIQSLKKDVMCGVFGKPVNMKSLVFWPRNKAYFTRSTGWAGKIFASNGVKILDSIVNNAVAHYVHNILYILGDETDSAASVENLQATLLRVNDIETFDTAAARFTLKNGATGTFVASHCTEYTVEPKFEYIFEKAKIVYSDDTKSIVAYMDDGTQKQYGDPFADGAANKFYCCLDLIRGRKNDVICGVKAAKEHVKFVAKLHENNKIIEVKKEAIKDKDGFLIVEGLGEMLEKCYEKDCLLESSEAYINEFYFAVIGLAHGHIYQMTNGLLKHGAKLKYVYDEDENLVNAFVKAYPHVKIAKNKAEILRDCDIKLVASADIPVKRAPLGMRVMRAGKDFFTAKAPVITLKQLQEVKKTVNETGRKFFVYYSERIESEAAIYAQKLIEKGEIGKVINVMILAPHKLGNSRPDWFFDREAAGGILTDIGSHQFEQFLTYTGNAKAEIVASNIANFEHKEYSGFDDFADCYIQGENGATGYIRVDWLTPEAFPVFGDGKVVILGTKGYIELRKFIDAGVSSETEIIIAVNNGKIERQSVKNKIEKPFFKAVIADCIFGTETAMPMEHAFYTMELALKAQKRAKRMNAE